MDASVILIVAFSVALGFFVQGTIGFGNFLSLPLLLTVLTIQESVALMAIFLFLFSLLMIFKVWGAIDKRILLELSVGGVVGQFGGIYLLKFGDPIFLKKLLGIVIILYAAHKLVKKRKIKQFRNLGLLFGLIGGIFAGLFGAGGPLFVTYITNRIEKAHVLRATIIGSLAIMNFTKIPLFVGAGLFTRDLFIIALYILPFFLGALYLGNRLYGKIDEKQFKHLVLSFLALAGVWLIVR